MSACLVCSTATRPAALVLIQSMGDIDFIALQIAVLVFEPERRNNDHERDADRPAAQYFGENTVSGVRCAIYGRQCRHDQHQRQTAPQKPPHDPLLSRLWPQHDPHAVAHSADLEKDPSDLRESNCPSVRGWGSVDRHLSHIRSVLSAGWLSIQKARVPTAPAGERRRMIGGPLIEQALVAR